VRVRFGGKGEHKAKMAFHAINCCLFGQSQLQTLQIDSVLPIRTPDSLTMTLHGMSSLLDLKLRCHFRGDAVWRGTHFLSCRTTLTSLDLSEDMGGEDMMQLAPSLRCLTKLKVLNLAGCRMTAGQARAIAAELKPLKCLQCLDLRGAGPAQTPINEEDNEWLSAWKRFWDVLPGLSDDGETRMEFDAWLRKWVQAPLQRQQQREKRRGGRRRRR
jgi:hypothetical protein